MLKRGFASLHFCKIPTSFLKEKVLIELRDAKHPLHNWAGGQEFLKCL